MVIKITTGEDLGNLFKGLSDDIVEANYYHQIYCDIANAEKDHPRVFDESNVFWTLTLGGFHDAMIIGLCRIYDQESSSLSLINFLYTIKSNLHLFHEQPFRDRLKDRGSEYVDLLANRNRVPSLQELEKDIKYSSKNNLLVEKLIIWRSSVIAHRGAKVSLGKVEILKNNPISQTKIKCLLDKSLKIYNYYSSLYKASTEIRQIPGHNDYKSLLNLAELGIEKRDKDIYG